MRRATFNVANLERLDFLETHFPVRNKNVERYQRARWLKNDYYSDVWQCQFDNAKFVIDWRARAGRQGGLLTSKRNANLLQALRC